MTELLSCPFCGSSSAEVEYTENEAFSFAVVCADCLAQGPLVYVHPFIGAEMSRKDEAAQKWNHRVVPMREPNGHPVDNA
jgi:Lar family restriction alleviation protein